MSWWSSAFEVIGFLWSACKFFVTENEKEILRSDENKMRWDREIEKFRRGVKALMWEKMRWFQIDHLWQIFNMDR